MIVARVVDTKLTVPQFFPQKKKQYHSFLQAPSIDLDCQKRRIVPWSVAT
jgi:hypothetical protein